MKWIKNKLIFKAIFGSVFYIVLLFSTRAGTKEYVVGSGSEFRFTDNKKNKTQLSIYITDSSFARLGVEYFFSAGGILGTNIWQQYSMEVTGTALSLNEGYIQSQDMKNAEIMTKDFRENNDSGVRVEDFFFTQEKDLEKNKIGLETIEVPAGSIITTHYQKKRNEQIVDFWISDQVGPIGLVKLISRGSSDQSYVIELESLLKNVKAKINPKSAIPLTEKGRKFLGKKIKK